MTLAQFRAIGLNYSDLGAALGDADLRGRAGRVYQSEFWIERTTRPNPEGTGEVECWHSKYNQNEYTSNHLPSVEEWLFKQAFHLLG